MNNHLKSILAIVFAFALCTSMTGCGGSKKNLEDLTEKDLENALESLDVEYGSNTESLTKSEKINPFENLKVSFWGTSPKSNISIIDGSSSVDYTPNIKSGMRNGDKITIKATLKSGYEESFSLTETEKEYSVDGLPAYATSIDEIPEDTKNKMLKQANDSFVASCASWREGNSLKQLDFIGYYFLTLKDGFSQDSNDTYSFYGEQDTYNKLYCVYKVTSSVTGLKRHGDGQTQEVGEETYYSYFNYSDIVLLSDGNCSVDLSSGSMTLNTIPSDYGYYDLIPTFYTYNGYKDLDTMFNECVTQNINNYNYETTVK